MKEKDQRLTLTIADGKRDSSNSSNNRKEIYDDSCFKAPLLLPSRKGNSRRRQSAINATNNNSVNSTNKSNLKNGVLSMSEKVGKKYLTATSEYVSDADVYDKSKSDHGCMNGGGDNYVYSKLLGVELIEADDKTDNNDSIGSENKDNDGICGDEEVDKKPRLIDIVKSSEKTLEPSATIVNAQSPSTFKQLPECSCSKRYRMMTLTYHAPCTSLSLSISTTVSLSQRSDDNHMESDANVAANTLVSSNDDCGVGLMQETIIDDFSLLCFENVEHLNNFQAEISRITKLCEIDERRRQYEENIRLGILKRRARRSRDMVDDDGTPIKDSGNRRNRKKMSEITENETNTEKFGDDFLINSQQKTPKKRQKKSATSVEAYPSTSFYMSGRNSTTSSVNSETSTATTASAVATPSSSFNSCSTFLKRSAAESSSTADDDGNLRPSEKISRLESTLDEYKNGLIGIAQKTDSSAILSPSSRIRAQTINGPSLSDLQNANCSNTSGKPSRPHSVSVDTRNTISTSADTGHPVDPGHDHLPSTSVAVIGGQLQDLNSAKASNLASSADPSFISAIRDSANRLSSVPNHLSPLTPSSSSNPAMSASPLMDIRQAFMNHPNFAALTNNAVANTNYGNLFMHGAAHNAFPYIAAHLLQQQQQQQQIQQAFSLAHNSHPPSPSTGTMPPVAGGLITGAQFPAGAALLGRVLPPGGVPSLSHPSLPIKAKHGRWCGMHIKIAYDIAAKKEWRSTSQQPAASSSSSAQSSTASVLTTTATLSQPTCSARLNCPPSTSSSNHMPGLTTGLSLSAIAAANALQSPFNIIPFQQVADLSKYTRQSGTPKQMIAQNRAALSINRNSAGSGIPFQMAGSGVVGHNIGSALSQSALHSVGALGSASNGGSTTNGNGLSSVVGTSLPITPAMSIAGSLTAGTSDAAAQAAMFAALAQSQQGNAGNVASSTAINLAAAAGASSNHFALSQQQSSAISGNASQAQLFPAQRLFDPSMALVIQQMQSMEAMRQAAAAATAQQLATVPNVSVSNASVAADLMRLQMEQQVMDRYAAALGNVSSSSVATAQQASPGLDLMRQHLLAAQIRQHQAQPSLEAFYEMQRQQQQQHLLNASRVLPAAFMQSGGAVNNANANITPSSSSSIPQNINTTHLFNPSHFMAMGGMSGAAAAAAAAANFQQSLYHKHPYSSTSTLEQLARQKRDGDMMQSDR